ncbi:S1C family serine protease [Actinocrispum wychmicini]|uniref:S1-C subfamily serine protease n=1 Tax=Actinocrispum wychmicini TaxID=1213861 RepID=A0A4R2J4U4_9PSEU|nr:trypsin-like peptidase domain-containing protein [Actinocrispum wychmicini]TCO52302.1 S1-C subfamily serine protease [Actinocrispum wychmicini]
MPEYDPTFDPRQEPWPPPPMPPPYPYPPPQWPPPRRRQSGLAVLLSVFGLIVLAAIGVAGWSIGHRSTRTPEISYFSPDRGQSSADIDSQAVGAKVAPGLVDVNTELGFRGGQAAGTGIVLTADGEVLTNNHVVAGATRIQVTDIGNGRTYQASVVGYARGEDIAVLKLKNAAGLATAPLGDSDKVAVGDAIVGIGNAGGVGGAPSLAPGTVTALNQSITASDESGGSTEQLSGLIQVNANIQGGDSGGALADGSGQVIGVDTAASAGYRLGRRGGGQVTATQGYAIPINQAVAIARQIQSGAGSATVHIGETAIIGVSVGGSTGATVSEVVAGGPAAQAGLAAGDVITSIGDTAIDSATTLTHLLDQHHPGDTVQVTWVDRVEQQHTATVRLATGPVG